MTRAEQGRFFYGYQPENIVLFTAIEPEKSARSGDRAYKMSWFL